MGGIKGVFSDYIIKDDGDFLYIYDGDKKMGSIKKSDPGVMIEEDFNFLTRYKRKKFLEILRSEYGQSFRE